MADPAPRTVYVWVWLPGQLEPVVAGRLDLTDRVLVGEPVVVFTYARSYRAHPDAMSLFAAELPLRAGTFDPATPVPSSSSWRGYPSVAARSVKPLAGVIRDAAPDAWGRRVLNARLANDPDVEFSELTYLLGGDSNRIGALDFSTSPRSYVARGAPATLDQLAHAAALIEDGVTLPEDLVAAAGHGTSIGGARPKALLVDTDGTGLVAKFSSTTDFRPAVKIEALGMVLAARAGVTVPRVRLTSTDTGADVLLVDRFDRTPTGARRLMVSALTVLGLTEQGSRYSSYVDLARAIRNPGWRNPEVQLRELFTRLVFNIAISNTDDHMRNHAAFWDGELLELTPAYDLVPGPRHTGVATHAINISDGRRASQFRVAVEASGEFHLTRTEALEVVDQVKSAISEGFTQACDQVQLSAAERDALWHREILNPYADYDHA